jgi:hypothetical protein
MSSLAPCRGVDHGLYGQGSANGGPGKKKVRRWEAGPCPNKTWKGIKGGQAALRAQGTGPRPWAGHAGRGAAQAEPCPLKRRQAVAPGSTPSAEHARMHAQAAAPGSAPPAQLLGRSKRLRMRSLPAGSPDLQGCVATVAKRKLHGSAGELTVVC